MLSNPESDVLRFIVFVLMLPPTTISTTVKEVMYNLCSYYTRKTINIIFIILNRKYVYTIHINRYI